jgi:hypothetical protein
MDAQMTSSSRELWLDTDPDRTEGIAIIQDLSVNTGTHHWGTELSC